MLLRIRNVVSRSSTAPVIPMESFHQSLDSLVLAELQNGNFRCDYGVKASVRALKVMFKYNASSRKNALSISRSERKRIILVSVFTRTKPHRTLPTSCGIESSSSLPSIASEKRDREELKPSPNLINLHPFQRVTAWIGCRVLSRNETNLYILTRSKLVCSSPYCSARRTTA